MIGPRPQKGRGHGIAAGIARPRRAAPSPSSTEAAAVAVVVGVAGAAAGVVAGVVVGVGAGVVGGVVEDGALSLRAAGVGRAPAGQESAVLSLKHESSTYFYVLIRCSHFKC